MIKPDFDIAIAGAGPAGLAFATLLSGYGLSVAVIDRQKKESLKNPDYDGREIALTHASWTILQKTGALDEIGSDAVSLLRDAKVINGGSSYSLNFSAREIMEDHLGYMIANNTIRRALYHAAIRRPDITIIDATEITGAETTDSCACLHFKDDTMLSTRLLVAADSRFSPLRGVMGIQENRYDFKRICIVCRMAHEKDLWRTAYEYFGYDRTLAILPLRNQECSVVMTMPQDLAEQMMQLPPEDFAQNIMLDLGDCCGTLRLVSQRFAYPLIGIYARQFQKRRFALIGDAAVGMHPVTAHGFNLGLRGANTLSGLIIKGESDGWDIADPRILKQYECDHNRVALPLYHGTNALVRLYTRTGPVSRLARRALLRLGNRLTPARHAILRSLTDREN